MRLEIDLNVRFSQPSHDAFMRRIEEMFHLIFNQGAKTMAAIDDLNVSLDNLQAALSANTAELVLLKTDLDAAIAAGNQDPVIAAAKARVDQMVADLQAADAANAPT